MVANGRKARRVRRLRRFLLGLAMIGMIAAAATRIEIDTDRLETWPPIQCVRVEGPLWYLDAEAFLATLSPFTRKGYFGIDLREIETAARSFAWVSDARVERIWPDTIVIRIREQVPVARWGADSLLNGRGESFTPDSVAGFDGLPLLEGPVGHEKEVLEMVRVLDRKLEARQLRITSLRLSRRLAWVAETTGGLEIVFGRQNPAAALDRLLALLPKLGEDRIATIRKLDVRYPNGFSVVWKPEAPVLPEEETELKRKSGNG